MEFGVNKFAYIKYYFYICPMKNCLKCNGELKPFKPESEVKEKYLKCDTCGAIHANISIPLYPKSKFNVID